MKVDLRKKTNSNKIQVEHILYRFYKVFDSETGKEVDPSIYDNYDENENGGKYFNQCYDVEGFEEYDVLDLKKSYAVFSDIVQKYGDQYDRIYIDFENNEGYLGMFRIVGKRLETDEELQERIDKEIALRQKAIKDKEDRKKAKEDNKRQKELEQLKKLQKKYDKSGDDL